MNWARYITGWAAVEVTGAEPERFLCALAERGITFWAASPPRDFALTVQIPMRAVKLAGPLAASLGCQAEVLSRRGLPELARKLCRRYVLLGCLLLALALLYVGSAFIWEISITGNETIPDRVIRQALAECGVDIGAFWPAMSQDAVRNGVILRVDGIRWMTVNIRGSHARAIVRESRAHLPLEEEKELARVVADKAGLVESVSAFRGTALTEQGRALLPGDEIIGAYMTGRAGVLGPVRAAGFATARTWYELTALAPSQTQEKAYTGQKTARWSLIIGKTRINFYKGSSICPVGCDKIIVRRPLAWEGVFALPIALEQTVYASYERQDAADTGRREQMQSQLMGSLQDAIGQTGEILSSAFSASERDGRLCVTLRAECRERIGQAVPLSEQELSDIRQTIPGTEDTSQ